MRPYFLILFVISMGISCTASAVDNVSKPNAINVDRAREAVNDFYNWYAKTKITSEHYTQKLLAKLHPELAAACEEENQYATDDGKRFPEDVPFIDGDIFWNSQEIPSSFEVGDAVQLQTLDFVEMKLVWKDGTKVVNERTEVVILKPTKDGPKITNILYPDQDSLVGTLRQSIEYYKGHKNCKAPH